MPLCECSCILELLVGGALPLPLFPPTWDPWVMTAEEPAPCRSLLWVTGIGYCLFLSFAHGASISPGHHSYDLRVEGGGGRVGAETQRALWLVHWMTWEEGDMVLVQLSGQNWEKGPLPLKVTQLPQSVAQLPYILS